MKKEKAKMRRIGGFMLEILILVFVFSYSYSWSGISTEDSSDNTGDEKHTAQIILGSFSCSTSLNQTITKLKIAGEEFINLDFTPVVIRLANSKLTLFTSSRVNPYFSNITINAP